MDGLEAGGEGDIAELVPELGGKSEVLVPAGVVADGGGVEDACFNAEWEVTEFVAGFGSDGAIIAHLLAHEGAVGKDVGGGSAECFHAKRHTELPCLEEEVPGGGDACICIKDFHFALVAEVGLDEVVGPGGNFAVEGEAGVAHLKAVFAVGGVDFKTGAEDSVDVRGVVNFFGIGGGSERCGNGK